MLVLKFHKLIGIFWVHTGAMECKVLLDNSYPYGVGIVLIGKRVVLTFWHFINYLYHCRTGEFTIANGCSGTNLQGQKK